MDQPVFTATYETAPADWRNAQWAYVRAVTPRFVWMWVVTVAIPGLAAIVATLIFLSMYLDRTGAAPIDTGPAGVISVTVFALFVVVVLEWLFFSVLRSRLYDRGFRAQYLKEPFTVTFYPAALTWHQTGWKVEADYSALTAVVPIANGIAIGLRSSVIFVPFKVFGKDAGWREICRPIAAGLTEEARARSKFFMQGLSK